MSKRGKQKWIPPRLMEEYESIKREKNLNKDSAIFYEIAEHCRVGREVRKMQEKFVLYDLWGNKKRR